MTPNRIVPDWEQLAADPLVTEELRTLAGFLNETLPPAWEIYVRPYLNGDRPDLVLLCPQVGMMFFDLNAAPLPSPDGTQLQPVRQAERYRENVIGWYVPQIGEAIDADPTRIAAFKVAVYFHTADTAAAQAFVNVPPTRCIVFGRDLLRLDALPQIVPDVTRHSSAIMQADWIAHLRFWLKPPWHTRAQGKRVGLTEKQKRHVKPAPQRHQRLRGPAGTGKTLIIAQRAARLAAEGKRVLVVTFNMTLWHYIQQQVAKSECEFSWENLEFAHFHGFCRNYLAENAVAWPKSEGHPAEDFFDRIVLSTVLNTALAGQNQKWRAYDAILIDEGQDFQGAYYQVLCQFLTANDELLLVADERQNIYDRRLDWLETMHGTKFRGAWRELTYNHRLPGPILEQVNAFITRFAPHIPPLPIPASDQLELKLLTPHLLWREIESFEQAQEKIWLAVDWLIHKKRLNPADIIILVPRHAEGWQLLNLFSQHGLTQVDHVLDPPTGAAESHPRHKKTFWPDDGRLKMSTIQRFKGWELRNVIILTAPPEFKLSETKMDALLYTALTRTQENLLVFNRHPKYRAYGQQWPNTWA